MDVNNDVYMRNKSRFSAGSQLRLPGWPRRDGLRKALNLLVLVVEFEGVRVCDSPAWLHSRSRDNLLDGNLDLLPVDGVLERRVSAGCAQRNGRHHTYRNLRDLEDEGRNVPCTQSCPDSRSDLI